MRCSSCHDNTSVTGPDGRCLSCLQDDWRVRHHVQRTVIVVLSWLAAGILTFALVVYLYLV